MMRSEMVLPKELLAHLKSPKEAGLLGSAAQSGQAENAACGDVLRLEVLWRPDGSLGIGYQVVGCGALIAVSSYCVSRLMGLGREQALSFNVESEVAAAGGLDRRGAHAVRVFERALAAAFKP